MKRAAIVARLRLVLRCDGILEVDDDHVGAGAKTLFQLPFGIAGNEQQRAHQAGLLHHHRLPRAFGDEIAMLVVGAVLEFDDAAIRLRFRFAHRDDRGLDADGVAMEDRVRKHRLLHAEIGDRRADGDVVDRNADHQAEREQRIDQRLAPFALGGEIEIDMQRLRVQRHHRKQHVVALGDGLAQRVLEDMADDELLEI